jgi:hypothetical protein
MIRSHYKLSLVTGVLLCAAITAVLAASPAPAEKPAGRKVAYATHSLQWDTPNPVTELAKAAGITGHEVLGVQRNGFSTATQIWNAGAPSKALLEAAKVDDFFLSIMEVPDEGIDNYVKLAVSKNPKIRVFIQNNWTAFNQDGQKQHQMGRGNTVSWDQTTVEMLKDLDTVYEKAIEEQIDKINKQYDHQVAFIIPTSQGVTTIRTKIAKNEFKGLERQSQLFADTIGHPAPPLIALNAYIHFATMYGISPVGLPKPTVLANARNLPNFNDESNKALQEIAWKVVQDYSKYDGVKVDGK